ncbi:MAG: hypothetical protein HY040_23145 [Planctomycetes bacterium]|nr:hypothetical protein [Planctomycetota bacterium]
MSSSIIMGYWHGMNVGGVSRRDVPNTFTYLGFAAVLLGTLGIAHAYALKTLGHRGSFRFLNSFGTRTPTNMDFFLAGGLLGYMGIIMYFDPLGGSDFIQITSYAALVQATGLLLPAVFATSFFASRASLLLALAAGTFLSALVAILFFNTRYSDYWRSFFSVRAS